VAFTTEWDTAPNPSYGIWTSVNGSEVIPGVISPLIATCYNQYDYEGLKLLMADYPAGRSVRHHKPPVGNFFGIVAGRLALNNGYSVAAMSALDADIAQAILGQFFTGASGGEKYIPKASAKAREASLAVANRQRAAAPKVLEKAMAQLAKERDSGRYTKDLKLKAPQAWKRFNDLFRDNQTRLINTHYIVSVGAGEFQVRLGGLLAAAGLPEAQIPGLVVGLCSGLGEVESSKPAVELYELARLARKHDDVTKAIRKGNVAAIEAKMAAPDSAGWRAFAKAFRAFLVSYGYRGQGEADPTNADWSERPEFALSQIKAMLAVKDADAPKTAIKKAAADRQKLEKQVRKSLPADYVAAFDAVLAQAQHLTRLRETSKAVWVMGVRRARAPYLALANRLAEAGVIADADDCRFLTMAEVDNAVAGKPAADLAARIGARRKQYVKAADYVLPDNWEGNAKVTKRPEATTASELAGLGVSVGAGPVTGTARIIPSAEAGLARDIKPGEILVAPFTDAPWTPLFITAGAVVVETGGVLSHAATVAREFGIPAVVMVKGATTSIADGDRVTVDGAAGTVTIVRRAGDAPAAKKPAAKRQAAKKAAARKPATKKPAAKKAATKPAVATAAAAAEKPAATKAAAEQAPAKKTAAKRAPAKKAAAGPTRRRRTAAAADASS
jgi:pyruvate,water dikinase